MKLLPGQECLYCNYRTRISADNKTECLNPSNEVYSTHNAKYLGYWNYPKNYAWQCKVTKCPNWIKREYDK